MRKINYDPISELTNGREENSSIKRGRRVFEEYYNNLE